MGANAKVETLWDLTRHGANVAVVCSCGKRGVIDGKKLVRWFAVHCWDIRIHLVTSRLRCTRCQGRPYRVGMTHDLATGPEWGPRSEEDWTRLVRRLRG